MTLYVLDTDHLSLYERNHPNANSMKGLWPTKPPSILSEEAAGRAKQLALWGEKQL